VGAKTLVLFLRRIPDSTGPNGGGLSRQARVKNFDSVFGASDGMVITLGSAENGWIAHMHRGTRTASGGEKAQFPRRVTGVTESGQHLKKKRLCEPSLQGAADFPRHHSPAVQSELQVTMSAGRGRHTRNELRGYVVRVDTGAAKRAQRRLAVFFTD